MYGYWMKIAPSTHKPTREQTTRNPKISCQQKRAETEQRKLQGSALSLRGPYRADRLKKKSTGRLAESLDGFRRLWNYEIMTQIVREERATSNSVAKTPDFW